MSFFFFSSRRRHTRSKRDWSSDVCSSDLVAAWMKAQADYTRAMLDAIPQRKVLRAEVTKYGDAASARVTSLQKVAGRAYYLKRNADENIPKLYVREGFGGKER